MERGDSGDSLYDCHYLSNLVGLMGTGDSDGIIVRVIRCEPYPTTTACVEFTVVVACTISVDGDSTVMNIESTGVVVVGW